MNHRRVHGYCMGVFCLALSAQPAFAQPGVAQLGMTQLAMTQMIAAQPAMVSSALVSLSSAQTTLAQSVMAQSIMAQASNVQSSSIVSQAEQLIGRGELQRAEAMLRRELQARPDAAAAYLLGYVLIQQYSYPEAESFLRQAVELKGSQAAYRHALAKSMLEQGKNIAAIAELDRAIAIDAQPDFYFAKAMCALNISDFDLAQSALEASVAIQPGNAQAWYQLGRIQTDMGNYANALVQLKRALAIDPTLIEARYLYGLALRRNDELLAAATAFKQVLTRVPGHVGALQNLGRVQYSTGDKVEARATLARFARVSDLRDEVEFLKSAVRKNPDNVDGRVVLARKQLEMGSNNDAVEQLLIVRRMQPQRAEIYEQLAIAFERQGQNDKARQASAYARNLRQRSGETDQ